MQQNMPWEPMVGPAQGDRLSPGNLLADPIAAGKEGHDQGWVGDTSESLSGACSVLSSSCAAPSSSSATLIESGEVLSGMQLYGQQPTLSPALSSEQQQQQQQYLQPQQQLQEEVIDEQQQMPGEGTSSILATGSSSAQGGGNAPGLATAWRLKVVGISEGYSEDQLRSLFSLCGNVVESRIVHDKQSGRPVGYGYVSFSTKEAADLAISTFDDQLQLQGAATFLSVYYAKKQLDTVQEKESCPARNAKLYFCGTPAGFRRDSILALFSAFGRVRHLQVYTDGYGVLSSGTVTMYSTEEATAAMNSLDGKVLQPGTAPLKVTWAQLSTLPRRNPAGGGPPPPMPKGFTVSYACIPTAVTPSEVAARFERFGMVLQVVPFAHRREGPLNSRGCGLVVMDSEAAAMEAVDALSGKFTWPGAERPLLVQPFYGAERMGPHQLPTLHDGPGGSPTAVPGSRGKAGPGSSGGRPRSSQHQQPPRGMAGYGGYRDPDHVLPGSKGAADGEQPPAGCAPDAMKLLLGNLPSSCTQSDIYALLQPYGTVVQVVRYQGSDPALDGTASVWYATGAQAEAALSSLRNTLLMTPDGPRQLTVTSVGPAGGGPGGWGGRADGMQHHKVSQGHQGSAHHSLDQGPAVQSRLGAAAGIIQMAQQHPLLSHQAQPAHMMYQQQQQQPEQHHQVPQYASLGHHYSPAGFQLVSGGGPGDAGGGMWPQQPPASTASGVPGRGGLPQYGGGGAPGVAVLAPGGPLAGNNSNRGAFDMQQLVYMLPQGGVVQQQSPHQQAVSTGMVGVATGQLWQPGAGGGGMLMPGQLNAHHMTNSGSVLEHAGENDFLAGHSAAAGAAAPVSGPPAAYTGWLY